jgi:cell division protein FtsW
MGSMTTTRLPANRPTPPTPPRRPASAVPTKQKPTEHSSTEHHTPGAVVAVRRIFAAEHANYFLLLGVTLFLVAFGLVMVLSSSSIDSYKENNGNSFASFLSQATYALIGVPLMLVASRLPASFWKRWAWAAVLLGLGLQLAVFVPGIGHSFQGNTNWIKLGSFSGQPSEVLKLALIVWMAFIFSRKEELLTDWKHVALPVAPVAGGGILLVLAGHDLGTALIMLGIVFSCLFFAGVRLKHLLVAAVGIGFLAFVFSATGASRTSRISQWMSGCPTDAGLCWQPLHGQWALASGGIFGVGLGNSKMKWSWLPESDNDYIFAIVGEELGLIGAIVVLLLFIVLAISFVRIVRSSSEAFTRIVAAGVMVWIIGQALVNIAVVLGLLPVLGVPLPLISAGGSALISSLLAIGVVLSLSRGPRRDDETSVEQTPAERSRLAAASRRIF